LVKAASKIALICVESFLLMVEVSTFEIVFLSEQDASEIIARNAMAKFLIRVDFYLR